MREHLIASDRLACRLVLRVATTGLLAVVLATSIASVWMGQSVWMLALAMLFATAAAAATAAWMLPRLMARRISQLTGDLQAQLDHPTPDADRPFPTELAALQPTIARLHATVQSAQGDATAQRQQCRTWQQRCEWFEQVLPLPVFELTASGRFSAFNSALAEIFSCSPTLDCDLSWQRALHEEDFQRVSNALALGLLERQPFKLVARLSSRFDGPRRLAFQVVPRLAPDGTLLGWIGFGQDESELAAQTELLERSESQRRLAIESTSDAIFTLNGQGQVLEFNPAAERLFDCARDQAVGRPVKELNLPEQLALPLLGMLGRWSSQDAHLDPSLFETLCRERLEVRPAGSGGPILSVEITSTRPDSSHRFYVTVVARDVTQQKQREAALLEAKEAAEAASRMKSEFLARMSHEIRTPLNGIMAESELALELAGSAERAPWHNVKTAADQLLGIVNDVLDLSKIQAGKLSLEAEPFDFRDVVRECVGVYGPAAEQKKLRLKLEMDERIPDILTGDARRLRQVLLNLIGNAVKFTEQGHVQVAVLLRKSNDQAVSLKFTVADTGIGIPIEKQQAIFDLFTQADASRTRKHGGLGLGLSISSLLVGMFNGRIWVESEPGRGSQFHFTLTLGSMRATSSRGQRLLRLANEANRPVLMVEDACTNGQVVESMLRSCQLRPYRAVTAADALKQVRAASEAGRPFVAVIIDTAQVNAQQLASQIESLSDETTPKLLFLLDPAEPIPAHGAWVRKPTTQAELFARLLELLNDEPARGSSSHGPTRSAGPATTAAPGRAAFSLNILLAEDDAISQSVARRMLERMGHRVVVAGDGRTAVDLWTQHRDRPFDCILMDLMMPGMDGLTATQEIRRQERALGSHVLIVALTANAMAGDREQCLQAGMDEYLAKPLRKQVLQDLLARRCNAQGGEQSSSSGTAEEQLGHGPPERFHRAELLQNCHGDVELAGQFVQIYLEQESSLQNAVAEAIERADHAALQANIRHLKSALVNLCAPNVIQLAAQLEAAAREKGCSGARPVWNLLEEELRELREVLQRIQSATGTVICTGDETTLTGASTVRPA